ncbi:IclR family transcriptional regulator [Sphingomonas crocodyli]|uniref:IclR family transcriptional regulator n=1 Tax=Sphingomonas crocodyli TaxID=1979270 RepID=A0A437M9E7_9SPHN|nr:IclR family transcriptional regulator [Sphingomonas crocodyli]RVT94207.1 IclR family transcriptional regulator [Sphingomonas crocodyli]
MRQNRNPGESAPSTDDSQFVTALARGMEVLDACARAGKPIGNSEIAALTGLPAPTVSRLTLTLYSLGYLQFLQRERLYTVGPRAAGLSATILRGLSVRRLARPEMDALAQDAHFNVGLGTRDGEMMVYVDTFEGEALIGLRLRAGSRIPIPTSAMGRAWLAAAPEPERTTLLDALRPRYGDEWRMIMTGIEQAARDIAARGYCISLGDWQKDIHGIAAPLTDPATGTVYAINLGGPAYMLTEASLRDDLAPRLLAITGRIKAQLGDT